MNLANATADRGDLPLVLETEQRLATQLRVALGAHHPETLAMISNMAVTLDAMGREEEAEHCGPSCWASCPGSSVTSHPLTQIARDERRFRRELEPLAV
ncbi:Tetratricopeptide repeat-containing protein OS=Streptomyces microflavus OX=1919 GN=Smic_14080 PE=4 SV=1 [Streptomyces microflavus]